MKHILKCEKCDKHTMKETCSCGRKTISTIPHRYSPQKFAKYRQKARKEDLEKKGLL